MRSRTRSYATHQHCFCTVVFPSGFPYCGLCPLSTFNPTPCCVSVVLSVGFDSRWQCSVCYIQTVSLDPAGAFSRSFSAFVAVILGAERR